MTNSLVLVPLLSWYDEEDEDQVKPSGSVGELVSLHKKDRVDNFLLEVVIANTLMELPTGSRWLQRLTPIFIGKKGIRNYDDFPFQNIAKLPDIPSVQTVKRASKILLKLKIPVDENMARVMAFSVKEHINRVTQFQGSKLSDLGEMDRALNHAALSLVNQIPELQRTLSTAINYQPSPAELEQALARKNESKAAMAALLDDVLAKSKHLTAPVIDTSQDHFDLMISYRVKTEKEMAVRLYEKIRLNPNADLQQAQNRCAIPQYARESGDTGELGAGIARTFLDAKHIPYGSDWEQVFVKAGMRVHR